MSRSSPTLATSLLLLAGAPAAALAQPADLEARLRALEARVAALEGRAPAVPAPSMAGPACRRLNVNGSQIVAGATLTVTVNGTAVATFDGNAYADLEPFMLPGPNRVALAFAGPGGPGTGAELRCLPPGVASSRTTILRLKPGPGRLRAETAVVLSGK